MKKGTKRKTKRKPAGEKHHAGGRGRGAREGRGREERKSGEAGREGKGTGRAERADGRGEAGNGALATIMRREGGPRSTHKRQCPADAEQLAQDARRQARGGYSPWFH